MNARKDVLGRGASSKDPPSVSKPAPAPRIPFHAWPTAILAWMLLAIGSPTSCLSYLGPIGLLISMVALFLAAMFYLMVLTHSEKGWRRRTPGGMLLAAGLALVCWSAWTPTEVFGSGRPCVHRPPPDASSWPFSKPDPALAYWLWKHPSWEAAVQWLACGVLVAGGIRSLCPRALALSTAAFFLAAATGPIMLRVCLHLNRQGWPTWD
jgi:hypothetical protein